MATSNFSVLVDLVPDVSSLRQRLNNQNIRINTQVTGTESVQEAIITWQQYRAILNLATRAIESLIGQTMKLDEALTNFKKVSTLSGNELDRYVDKLAQEGKQVARTGKPNRSGPE